MTTPVTPQRIIDIEAGYTYSVEVRNFLPGTALAATVHSGDDADADVIQTFGASHRPATSSPDSSSSSTTTITDVTT